MRLLSLKLNAESNTTPQGFVQILLDWISTNKYYSFSNTELNEILNFENFKPFFTSFIIP